MKKFQLYKKEEEIKRVKRRTNNSHTELSQESQFPSQKSMKVGKGDVFILKIIVTVDTFIVVNLVAERGLSLLTFVKIMRMSCSSKMLKGSIWTVVCEYCKVC